MEFVRSEEEPVEALTVVEGDQVAYEKNVGPPIGPNLLLHIVLVEKLKHWPIIQVRKERN